MSETKMEIRKRILAARSGLNMDEVRSKSAAIFDRIVSLGCFKNARLVMAYMDYKNEVTTKEFILKCLDEGKQIALPRIGTLKTEEGGADISGNADSRVGTELAAFTIRDIDRDTEPGFKGIIEPVAREGNRVNPADIDLVIVPGVAFDRDRNRLGYGAGYYDRFLRKLRGNCPKIAVAFGLQVVDRIPADRHDIPVDMVATEDSLIR